MRQKRILKEFTIASRKIRKFLDSQLRIDRTEEICIQTDDVAQKDFTYRMSSEEFLRFWKTWSISLSTHLDEIHWWNSDQTSLTKMHRLPPWVWRRAICIDSFLAVSEMAPVVLFIQHIMVAVERFLVELINSSKSSTSELVRWAAS